MFPTVAKEKSKETFVQTADEGINKLPLELLVHIFSFLNETDLFRLARVSRTWKNATDSSWKSLYERYFNNKSKEERAIAKPFIEQGHTRSIYDLPLRQIFYGKKVQSFVPTKIMSAAVNLWAHSLRADAHSLIYYDNGHCYCGDTAQQINNWKKITGNYSIMRTISYCHHRLLGMVHVDNESCKGYAPLLIDLNFAQDKTQPRTLRIAAEKVTCTCVCDEYYITGGEFFEKWDIETGSVNSVFKSTSQHSICFLGSQQHTLVMANREGELLLWDIKNGKSIWSTSCTPIDCIAFSFPYILTGHKKPNWFEIRDIRYLKSALTLPTTNESKNTLHIALNHSVFISNGYDSNKHHSTINIYSLATGERLLSNDVISQIKGLAFCQDQFFALTDRDLISWQAKK